jgi:RNA-binding protein YlmH
MDDDSLLKNKISDTANRAYHQNMYTYTNFLSIDQLNIYYQMLPSLNFIHSRAFGGNDSCERQMIQFGSCEEFGYEGDFPIDLIKITPLSKKFAEELSHRDYLGALMNLGIERSLLGDIVIREKEAYLFCVSHITDFIIDNLTTIKHTHIRCEKTDAALSDIAPVLCDCEIICASPRIDAVAAGITKLSRSKAVEFFRSQKVFVNGKVMENNSYTLKDGDILVIRGFGKFIYNGCGNETRKGRVYVKLQKYV